MKQGRVIIISSPSGAGKTTICKKLLELNDLFYLSISATTRKKRPGEVDAKDYYFLDELKFKKMIENDEFLEYAKVFDNFYGTPKEPVEKELAGGRYIIFDVDWQGARIIKEKFKNNSISIFILPPSIEELRKRLEARGQDSKEVIDKRMIKAQDEISHAGEYDYQIINDDIRLAIYEIINLLVIN